MVYEKAEDRTVCHVVVCEREYGEGWNENQRESILLVWEREEKGKEREGREKETWFAFVSSRKQILLLFQEEWIKSWNEEKRNRERKEIRREEWEKRERDRQRKNLKARKERDLIRTRESFSLHVIIKMIVVISFLKFLSQDFFLSPPIFHFFFFLLFQS